MTLQELVNTIKAKKFLFEILISDKKTGGKHSVEQTELLHGSIEEYIRKIAKANNVSQIGVNLFSPNGSSFIKKHFFLVDIEPVVESTNNVEASTKIVEVPTKVVDVSTNPVEGIEELNNTKTKLPMDHIETKIKNAELTSEIRYLKKENERLAEQNKKLDRKNEELYDQNRTLSLSSETKKQQLELEFANKELDLKKEKESGLNGLLDSVKEMPTEAWQMLAGFFPNHPMNKNLPAGSEKEINTTTSEKHPDADAQSCIELMVKHLVKSDVNKVSMITMIFGELLKSDKKLASVYKYTQAKPKDAKEENEEEEQEEEENENN